jgi:hypothetical protein
MVARLAQPHEHPYHIVSLYSDDDIKRAYAQGIKELKQKQPKNKVFDKIEKYIDMINKGLNR